MTTQCICLQQQQNIVPLLGISADLGPDSDLTSTSV